MNGISGKISYFGGPNESTASGAPSTKPGIAFYNRGTLGGYWLMKLPNGVIRVLQQTDLGPAPWTKRKFDFTVGALPLLGYSTSNFPTDATAEGIYLGKDAKRAAEYAGSITGRKNASFLIPGVPGLGELLPKGNFFEEQEKYAQKTGEKIAKAPGELASGISATAKVAGVTLEWIEKPIRIVEFIGGMFLLYMGFSTLTRTGAGGAANRERRSAIAKVGELAGAGAVVHHTTKRTVKRLRTPKASAA